MVYEEIKTKTIEEGIGEDKRISNLAHYIEIVVSNEITSTGEFEEFIEELIEDEGDRREFLYKKNNFDGKKILDCENPIIDYRDMEDLIGEGFTEYYDSEEVDRETFGIASEIIHKARDINHGKSFQNLQDKYESKLYNYKKKFIDFTHYALNEVKDKRILSEKISKAYDGIMERIDEKPSEEFSKIIISNEKIKKINEENKQYYEKLEATKRILNEKIKIIEEFYENNK